MNVTKQTEESQTRTHELPTASPTASLGVKLQHVQSAFHKTPSVRDVHLIKQNLIKISWLFILNTVYSVRMGNVPEFPTQVFCEMSRKYKVHAQICLEFKTTVIVCKQSLHMCYFVVKI